MLERCEGEWGQSGSLHRGKNGAFSHAAAFSLPTALMQYRQGVVLKTSCTPLDPWQHKRHLYSLVMRSWPTASLSVLRENSWLSVQSVCSYTIKTTLFWVFFQQKGEPTEMQPCCRNAGLGMFFMLFFLFKRNLQNVKLYHWIGKGGWFRREMQQCMLRKDKNGPIVRLSAFVWLPYSGIEHSLPLLSSDPSPVLLTLESQRFKWVTFSPSALLTAPLKKKTTCFPFTRHKSRTHFLLPRTRKILQVRF